MFLNFVCFSQKISPGFAHVTVKSFKAVWNGRTDVVSSGIAVILTERNLSVLSIMIQLYLVLITESIHNKQLNT